MRSIPAFREPAARVELMDEQGLDRTLMFPTLASLLEARMRDSGYSRYQSDWTGPREMLPFRPDAFRMLTMGKRPIEDAMAALVCHGTLTRFPELRVASIENGADWVVPFLEHLEDIHRKMPQAFDEDPVDAFRRNVHVSPFHEDDIAQLVDVIGADHILFGSDYPHPEGLAEPCSYVHHLPDGLADDVVAAVMGGNLGRLMRVEAPTPA